MSPQEKTNRNATTAQPQHTDEAAARSQAPAAATSGVETETRSTARSATAQARAAAQETAAGRTAQTCDFTDVVETTANMRPAEVAIASKSPYRAMTSYLGTLLLAKAGQEGPVGGARPDYVSLGWLDGSDATLVATPALTASNSTVPVRWTDGGTTASISLHKLFALRRFPLPSRTVAHIPVSVESIEGRGPSLLVHLNQAVFSPIQPRKGRQPGPNPDASR